MLLKIYTPSKVDWWIGALIFVGVPALLIYSFMQTLTDDPQQTQVVVASGILYLIALFGVIFPIRYEITDDALIIKSGYIKRSVPLQNISGVHPTMNPLSSPALSMHRLRIQCNRRYPLLISPNNREEFLKVLAERSPHLKRRGDTLHND